jgi:hypothetical protein
MKCFCALVKKFDVILPTQMRGKCPSTLNLVSDSIHYLADVPFLSDLNEFDRMNCFMIN